MSRIVIWSPNFAPELTGIPPLVTCAAEWLAGRGHRVDVVTALPNYPERCIFDGFRGALYRSDPWGPVQVHRSWLRVRPRESFVDKILYELSFSGFSLPNALRYGSRADALVCVVPSLTAAVYATVLARVFRVRLVLWVQDLVLSAAAAVDGVGRRKRRVLEAARVLERFATRGADVTVVCSPGFRDYLVGIGADPDRVRVLLNWADIEEISATPPTNGHPPRFLYAGNLGYTQGFETLVDAARQAGSEIELDIVGAGNAAATVAELTTGIPHIHVRPPVPAPEFPHLLAHADVQVVIQRRVAAGANLPSKIATYLASGRPIVASIDSSTPAAQLLRESGAAVVVEPESADALAAAMLELARRPDVRLQLGRRAREFAERSLTKDLMLQELEAAILG